MQLGCVNHKYVGMRHRFRYGVISMLVAAVLLGYGVWRWSNTAGVSSQPPEVQEKKIHIVTSFYPLYFFTKAIVGGNIDVYNLTPAGAEPHDYEPTPKDVVRLETSNLIIVNGAFEPWADNIKENIADRQIQFLAVGAALFSKNYLDEAGASMIDPHVWLSPRLATQIVEKILVAVMQIDPAHAEEYRLRAATLQVRLSSLDQEYRQGLARCHRQDFVTSHNAFGYLAAEYGLNQIGIAGLSPDAEPSPRELVSITTFAKIHDIRYIFFESLVSPKLAETIANEIGAKTLVLNPLEGLTDEDIASGQEYFSVMQKNLVSLRLVLECV